MMIRKSFFMALAFMGVLLTAVIPATASPKKLSADELRKTVSGNTGQYERLVGGRRWVEYTLYFSPDGRYVFVTNTWHTGIRTWMVKANGEYGEYCHTIGSGATLCWKSVVQDGNILYLTKGNTDDREVKLLPGDPKHLRKDLQ